MNRNITVKLLNALEKGSRGSKHISTKEYIKNYTKIKTKEKAIKWLEDFYANTNQTSCNLGDLQLLQDILEGNL